jgi:HEPN domain-containing protein
MTPEEWRRDEADRWLAQAAKDLHAASLLMTAEPSASVFHSQQCAEKSEKALLTLYGAAFRKTHDLKELGEQCALLQPSLTPLLSDAANLTDYAVVFRYLDAPHEPDVEEAVRALEIAEKLCVEVRARVEAEPEVAAVVVEALEPQPEISDATAAPSVPPEED